MGMKIGKGTSNENLQESPDGVFSGRCPGGGTSGRHDWSRWERHGYMGLKSRECENCEEDEVKKMWFGRKSL